nr:electron transfer flavoprotein beta subunit/FixA family protein [Propionicimonas sp.]
MIIAVAYKWAGDPQEAEVGPDGAVDLTRAKPVVSDYDAVAIEVARQLAAATGAELVGLCVGGPAATAPMATKSALARGLDRVVVLTDDSLATAGATSVAAGLAALVARLGEVSLVVAGDSSIDLGAKMVPSVLAGLLGWPALTDVNRVELADGGLVVDRVLGSAVQQLRLTLPAVIAVATDSAAARVPGMKDVLAAGRKPVEIVSVADVGLSLPDEGAVRATGRLAGPARRGVRIDGSDPQAAAAQLVAALASDGLLANGGAR